MPSSIFKSYDIRGLAPEEINETLARRLGKALVALYKPAHVVVGHDMRETSGALEEALVEALTVSGASVTRIGLCSTPMFNAAIGEANGGYDLGVMVTASHNPSAYNGFKLTRGDVLPIGQGSGMEEIRDLVMSEAPLFDRPHQGKVTQDDGLLDRYVERVWQTAGLPESLRGWRIAVDAGNGMAGVVLPKLLPKKHGAEVIKLYWEPDGTFPNHEANPLKPETLNKLRQTIVENQCAFGAAFDGDADRVGFVDEKGVQIPGDLLTALFARELLRAHPGAKVLYDLRSSWSVPETVREAGGEPIMCRVGHAHIKKQMREEGAAFGGELSMHFYFHEFWNCESGDYALLLMLKLLMREQKPLSQLWMPLKKYAHSGEINFTVKNQADIIHQLEEYFQHQATDTSHLDGLRMEFRYPNRPEEDWWFNVRSSNTEPLLRLNLEARTEEEMERRKQEMTALITRAV